MFIYSFHTAVMLTPFPFNTSANSALWAPVSPSWGSRIGPHSSPVSARMSFWMLSPGYELKVSITPTVLDWNSCAALRSPLS